MCSSWLISRLAIFLTWQYFFSRSDAIGDKVGQRMKQLSLEGLHDLFCNPVFGWTRWTKLLNKPSLTSINWIQSCNLFCHGWFVKWMNRLKSSLKNIWLMDRGTNGQTDGLTDGWKNGRRHRLTDWLTQKLTDWWIVQFTDWLMGW